MSVLNVYWEMVNSAVTEIFWGTLYFRLQHRGHHSGGGGGKFQ